MAEVEALIAAMTLEEKAALTAGEDIFTTPAVERLGIPKVQLTDGPSGSRGVDPPGFTGAPSVVVPCGSALGATWNPSLAGEIGALLGRESRERGCRVLLAPTVNLHRAVLAGRNFECYSEDPELSAQLAAEFVSGVQGEGVIATIKHFVGNESEFERASMNSEIDERTLRELYLVPFERAVRAGGVLGIMTGYNRLGGSWLTEQQSMLTGLLRDEWGFEGLVMTDWFGVADTVISAEAGLDLEMPGPGRAFGPALAAAVESGVLDESVIDEQVRRLLGTYDRLGLLDETLPGPDPGPDRAEDRALARRAATESMVLLANGGVLPLDATELSRVAVVGPNAGAPLIMGGGSSSLTAHRYENVVSALASVLPGIELVHRAGGSVDIQDQVVGGFGLEAADGFDVQVFDGVEGDGDPIRQMWVPDARFLFIGAPEPSIGDGPWRLRAAGTVVPQVSGTYRLALAQAGRTRVMLDGAVVLDGVDDPPLGGGTAFYGLGSHQLATEVELTAGQPVGVILDFATHPGELVNGAEVTCRLPESDDAFDDAVDAARNADAAIVVVGSPPGWEEEGRNRVGFGLPGRQDDLVRAVAAANPRTVVVVNSGAAVDLPWADDVAAVLQCWFGGYEMAGALADVLTGAAEPGGRLAVTLPERLEHSPSYDNFPGENGEVRYGEGLFMGYRGHDHRCLPVRFPFGHGLGYTSFTVGEPALSSTTFEPGDRLTVRVPVTNTGARRGSEVVQCYIAPQQSRLARPPQELKAFAKVEVDPGETTEALLELDDRSFAYWDPGQGDWADVESRLSHMFGVEETPPHERRAPGWYVDPGRYELRIGRSSRSIDVTCEITV